jgi:hypothetical protein
MRLWAKKAAFIQKIGKYSVLPQDIKDEVRRGMLRTLQARNDCQPPPVSRNPVHDTAINKSPSSE